MTTEEQLARAYEALEDVRSKIEDYVAGKINWRPDDFLYRVNAALANRTQPQQLSEYEKLYGSTPRMDWDRDYFVRITDGKVVSYSTADCHELVEVHKCAELKNKEAVKLED